MIEKTMKYLKEAFQSEYCRTHPAAAAYRLEHSIRVANIGREIAVQEGMDAEAMTIACLLHDLSYCTQFCQPEGWIGHGRQSAKMARPFLASLGLQKEKMEQICFGIAIHVDDQADFPGERTAFARTVGDSDNIDRFNVYRIFDGLRMEGFQDKTLEEKEEFVRNRLTSLSQLCQMQMATKTVQKLWQERIQYQRGYYTRLKKQLEESRQIG